MNWAQEVFSVPLMPIEGEVYMPQPEASLPKHGVSAAFLADAEEYFTRFKNYGYLYTLMSETFKRLDYTPEGLVVDFGSGFGNSVIPLLENYDIQVIATDISPNLLQILKREARLRGFQDRCSAVAQDAQNCYFLPKRADLVVGCAVLHHMVEPLAVVRAATTVLKSGGKAVFFEPFELGHQILQIAYRQILAEAKQRKENGAGFDYLAALNQDIHARTHRGNFAQAKNIWKNPLSKTNWEALLFKDRCNNRWKELDDKWLFCASHFKKISDELGCKIEILPLHDNQHQFTRQTKVALESYGGLKCPDALPDWAWSILNDFDENYFSPEGLLDLPIEACVVITAP